MISGLETHQNRVWDRDPATVCQAETVQRHCPGTPRTLGERTAPSRWASQCLLGSGVSCTGRGPPSHARRDERRDQQHELGDGKSLPAENGLRDLRAGGRSSLAQDQDLQSSSKHPVDKFQAGEEQPGLRDDAGTWWRGS